MGACEAILRDHGDAWLLLAGQDEVDRGEFVTKYLSAIAYTLDCREQLDVHWCHYTSPARHPPDLSMPLGMTYNGELQLENAQVSHLADPRSGQSYLLLALDWLAKVKPSVDYVVTLRLIDASGGPGGAARPGGRHADWPVVADDRLGLEATASRAT